MVPRQSPTVHALLVAAPTALALWMVLQYLHIFVFECPLTAGATVPYLIMGGVWWRAWRGADPAPPVRRTV